MTTRKTTATKTSAPRQTQKGVARAATARKRTDSNAAKVEKINAAQKQVEQTITDVLTGKTTAKQAESILDATVATVTPVGHPINARKRAPKNVKAVAEKIAADNAAKTTAKITPAKLSAATKKATAELDELRASLRGAAVENADKIMAATSKLRAAELTLTAEKIDARNPSTKDSTTAHVARDAAIKELIKLDAGWTYIARVRGIASSTNRGYCRVLMGGKRI